MAEKKWTISDEGIDEVSKLKTSVMNASETMNSLKTNLQSAYDGASGELNEAFCSLIEEELAVIDMINQGLERSTEEVGAKLDKIMSLMRETLARLRTEAANARSGGTN